MGLAFLNYRREDAGAAAQAIYAQMKVHFGSGQLFMDVNSELHLRVVRRRRGFHASGVNVLREGETSPAMEQRVAHRHRGADDLGREE